MFNNDIRNHFSVFKWLSFSSTSSAPATLLLSLLSWAYMDAPGIRSERSSSSRWWREGEAERLKGSFSCTSSPSVLWSFTFLWRIWNSALRWVEIDACMHSYLTGEAGVICCSVHIGVFFVLFLLPPACLGCPWKLSIHKTILCVCKYVYVCVCVCIYIYMYI